MRVGAEHHQREDLRHALVLAHHPRSHDLTLHGQLLFERLYNFVEIENVSLKRSRFVFLN